MPFRRIHSVVLFIQRKRQELINYTNIFSSVLIICIVHGEVYALSENIEGVAAWLPSNKAVISKIQAIRVVDGNFIFN